jgi:hypothetical protein
MWIDTAVVDAKPVITLGVPEALRTCLRSKPTSELAGIDTAGTTTTPSRAIVDVAADVAALANTILVTTVTVDVVGTVYSVVLDVAAAVRDSALDVTAIVYCILSVRCMHP